MSSFNYDFNPLLRKVQTDISFLCYLGLHQYAKENNLIGRSRPMITKDLDLIKQKRLNFRLMVACIQQIIGSKTMRHGDRVEQINYVNVQEYSTLRLYGLIDAELFAVYTDKDRCYTGYWPQQIDARDIDMLRSPAPLETIRQDLGYNTRAMMEVGGDIFTEKLRRAVRFLPMDLVDATVHQQRDPKNRMNVKNLAIQMKLVETKHYRAYGNPNLLGRIGYNRGGLHEMFSVPTHIEQLLNFQHVVWPWILQLQQDEARTTLMYVAKNFPSVHAVQMKMRTIRDSAEERRRIQRLQQQRAQQREEDRERLRERLLAIYGDRQRATTQETEDNNHIHIEYIAGDRPNIIAFDEIDEHGDPVAVIPDVHHGHMHIDDNEDIEDRVRRALDLTTRRRIEEPDEDPEIPF